MSGRKQIALEPEPQIRREVLLEVEHGRGERDATEPDGEAVPHRFSDELLSEATNVYSERAGKQLNREGARQILENTVGFFELLAEWDAAAKQEGAR